MINLMLYLKQCNIENMNKIIELLNKKWVGGGGGGRAGANLIILF